MDQRDKTFGPALDLQGENGAQALAQLAKLWDGVFVIIGFRGTEMLTSVSAIAEDETPPRVKSWQEISGELSALEDRNGVPLCVIAFKEYEHGHVQFTARPCRDFADDPWAKGAFEHYIEDGFNRLTKRGFKIQDLQPEKLH